MTQEKVFPMSPEDAYRLVAAALNLVGGISPGVHKRIRRDMAARGFSSFPTVRPADVITLTDILNDLHPSRMADVTIAAEHEAREARRAEQKAASRGAV